MQENITDIEQEMLNLISDYRDRCLWFLRPDFTPTSTAERLQVLDLIERYGDRSAYHRVKRIRTCLLQSSKVPS